MAHVGYRYAFYQAIAHPGWEAAYTLMVVAREQFTIHQQLYTL